MGIFDETDVDDHLPDHIVKAIDKHLNTVVHGDKTFTENKNFNKLLNELNARQKANQVVTKEEIDWLVEELASIDQFTVNKLYKDLSVTQHIDKDSNEIPKSV